MMDDSNISPSEDTGREKMNKERENDKEKEPTGGSTGIGATVSDVSIDIVNVDVVQNDESDTRFEMDTVGLASGSSGTGQTDTGVYSDPITTTIDNPPHDPIYTLPSTSSTQQSDLINQQFKVMTLEIPPNDWVPPLSAKRPHLSSSPEPPESPVSPDSLPDSPWLVLLLVVKMRTIFQTLVENKPIPPFQ